MSVTIREAIRKRHQLAIDYGAGRRIIEPHAYGYGSDGQELLRAFQIDGASASGEPHNWKLLRLDRIREIADTGIPFVGPRLQYNPDDPAMTGGIIERLP